MLHTKLRAQEKGDITHMNKITETHAVCTANKASYIRSMGA